MSAVEFFFQADMLAKELAKREKMLLDIEASRPGELEVCCRPCWAAVYRGGRCVGVHVTITLPGVQLVPFVSK